MSINDLFSSNQYSPESSPLDQLKVGTHTGKITVAKYNTGVSQKSGNEYAIVTIGVNVGDLDVIEKNFWLTGEYAGKAAKQLNEWFFNCGVDQPATEDALVDTLEKVLGLQVDIRVGEYNNKKWFKVEGLAMNPAATTDTFDTSDEIPF